MKRLFSAIATLICIASCSSVRQEGNVITVRPEEGPAKKVRLEVISEGIVRVSATPESKFSGKPSLMVLDQPEFKDFSVENKDGQLCISTASLQVKLSLKDGKVSFYRADGELILSEKDRSFKDIVVDGSHGYTVTQTFSSPDDNEGIYGLGQHQSEEFNYKGKSEELYQYNTKVSVPFAVSSRSYGVLWDSYSFCRFGNPGDWQNLSVLDAKITGTYTAPGHETLVREEKNLDFDHLITGDLDHVHGLPQDFPMFNANVCYEAYIYPKESGIYEFSLYYAGYQSVEIDGKEVVPERWRTAWNPNTYKFSVELEGGKEVPIKINWVPNGSVSYCALKVHLPESEEDKASMRWWGEMQQQIDYYLIAADSSDGVTAGYRKLTGKAPIMPKWAMGYWQSREKYNTQEELLEVLNEYRKREIPIDNIVLDWLHWEQDSWGSHEFDRARFPDPKQMVDSIHAMDARIMISVWPKFYVTTEHYKEFDEHGWMYTQAVRDSIRDWVGPGYLGSFYDAYSAPARKLFWQQIYDHYYPLGFDAWWMDASEPNIRDCTDMDYRKALCGPTALGTSTEYFNAYALMNAEAIYDGQRGVEPDKRVFLLTRSGYCGQQRYSTATWSGDIATRWEDMRAQLTAGLNFCATGIPFWTMDIGGFCVEDRYVRAQRIYDSTGKENEDLKEWRELNARWFQFGAFAPLYRAHGQFPYREIYNLAPEGHPAYESMTYYTRLRYKLMPYLYSLAAACHYNDYTMMRALYMDFPDDATALNAADEYMFGPAFLVAPVCEYKARSREVYLPDGTWYNFYDSRATTGGRSICADAPYGRMPLFVRAGSILPMGPVVQNSAEKGDGPLQIRVYAGKDASFTLYDDEGVNYNYEKGLCSRISLVWNEAESTLTIGERQGSFPGMEESIEMEIVKVDSKGEGKAVRLSYNGSKSVINL